MSATRSPATAAAQLRNSERITELRVSGHLMTLDTGTFCLFHAPGSGIGGDAALGLPGVRISLPPGPAHRPDQISISTFRPDGWLGGSDAAALIRVVAGPAQVLVTIYQAPGQGAETAPRLQVLRLDHETPGTGEPAVAPAGIRPGSAPMATPPEVTVHVQATGDVAGRFGDWAGSRTSRKWIEGFSIRPPAPLELQDIEYQAVLGRNWLSPWVHGGEFCGSRGMALPLLGLRVRLKGEAERRYGLVCHASFVDGTDIGPVAAGAACEAASLAPLEAFQIILSPKAGTSDARPAKPPIRKPGPPKRPRVANVAQVAVGKPAGKAKPVTQAKRPVPPGRPAR